MWSNDRFSSIRTTICLIDANAELIVVILTGGQVSWSHACVTFAYQHRSGRITSEVPGKERHASPACRTDMKVQHARPSYRSKAPVASAILSPMLKTPAPPPTPAPHGPDVRFRLRITRDDTIALGPGKVTLLEAVREQGSISAAARSLNMSYRRAWMLVDELNQSLSSPP